MKNLSRKAILSLISGGCTCAEIGVWRGEFSSEIYKALKPSSFYLIDPWHSENIPNAWYSCSQLEMDQIYLSVLDKFKDYPEVSIVRRSSKDAYGLFGTSCFDFVYIDGCHLYEFAKDDIVHYFDLLKPGGILTGDDYGVEGWWQNGVTKAFDEFDNEMVVEKWTLGNQFFLRRK